MQQLLHPDQDIMAHGFSRHELPLVKAIAIAQQQLDLRNYDSLGMPIDMLVFFFDIQEDFLDIFLFFFRKVKRFIHGVGEEPELLYIRGKPVAQEKVRVYLQRVAYTTLFVDGIDFFDFKRLDLPGCYEVHNTPIVIVVMPSVFYPGLYIPFHGDTVKTGKKPLPDRGVPKTHIGHPDKAHQWMQGLR